MKSNKATTIDTINRNIKSQAETILSDFGPITRASHLIKHRKKIGIANKTLGLSPEQLTSNKVIAPDFSLVHPNSVEARLQKYIVLTYSNKEDLEHGKSVLEKNPSIISARVNKKLVFSSSPNDPFFVNQNNHQWGMFDLNLPNAWNITSGHAYIGVPDSGLDISNSPTAHLDLSNFRPQFSKSFENGNLQDFSGHGTHVTGIIAATTNNNGGVAGVCHQCSISFAQVWGSSNSAIQAYNHFADVGVQAINSSWHLSEFDNSGSQLCTQPTSNNAIAFCDSLEQLTQRDIIVSAAAGNGLDQINTYAERDDSYGRSNFIEFPASDPRTIAVGATNITGNRAQFSDYGPELDLVAAGNNVFSTFSRDVEWNADWFCGDAFGPGNNNDGYGSCSGTSMSAPHITGVLGLMRSTNPLLHSAEIKQALFSSGPYYPTKNNQLGHGTPDVKKALDNILGTVNGSKLTNRLTPLFATYSVFSEDSFYTTVPQMVWSSIVGTLPPLISNYATALPAYGSPIPTYPKFPHDETGNPPQPQPLAEVYIFTTKHNPITPSQDLVPLYRLSYQGTNGSNIYNTDHVYTTEQAGITGYQAVGYKLDGIEGYIFSNQYGQPIGTEKLLRRYNTTKDDHAIFPESKYTIMTNAGYNVIDSGSTGYIGYVYKNEDADNDYLIDGFERAIGTCLYDSDSDNDGVQDGDEIFVYPYSDPLDTITACGSTSQPEFTWKNNATGTLYSNISWNYAMGYHFTPQVNGTIDQLGGYFNGTKTVKLFNKSTGALLGQTTASTNNSWGYGSITPVAVQAGTQYTVAVYLNGSGASYRNLNANLFPVIYDNIKIDGSTFTPTYSNPTARPTNNFTNLMFGQADIRFTPN